jgi:hypothetical protein
VEARQVTVGILNDAKHIIGYDGNPVITGYAPFLLGLVEELLGGEFSWRSIWRATY